MSTFKEYEQLHINDAPEAPEEQEAQTAPEAQEPLTVAEIEQAAEALHTAAVKLSALTNPEANEPDAVSFAHTPYYSDYLADALQSTRDTLRPEIRDNADKIPQAAQKAQEAYTQWQTIRARFYGSEQWRQLQEALPDITLDDAEYLLLMPVFIQQSVEALPAFRAEQKKREKGSSRPFTFYDLINLVSAKKEPTEPAEPAELPSVAGKKAQSLRLPFDKVNAVYSGIWGMIEQDLHGQLIFKTESKKDGQRNKYVNILATINFDELEQYGIKLSKNLDEKDKRIYIAAAGLFAAGNEIITAQQIYFAMGNRGRANSGDIKDIDERLTRMTAARIFIDNEQETAAGYKYDRFKYDGSLFPMERIRAYINGQLAESAIHLLRYPPLVSFGVQRGQFAEIPRAVLESPVSKTLQNLRIDDYLLEQISHMKNNKSFSRRILWETLYNNCRVITATKSGDISKNKKRTQDKVYRYLDHYASCGFIAGFTKQPDGITIQLTADK